MEGVINKLKSQKNYKNDFGELNGDGIILFVHHRKQTIKFEDIVKIRWLKTQRYHFNCLAFVMAIFLLFFVKNNSLDQNIQFFLLFVSFFFFAGSFFLKSFQYTFLLVQNNTFIALDVSKELSQDAERLVYQFNNRVYSM
jgi:hypothetical protein